MLLTTLPALAEEPAKEPAKAAAKGGLSEEELKQANNPLANASAFNIQNYYVPKLYDLPDKSSNTAWARVALSTWRILWRASLPLSTVPGVEESVSGLGDFNVFGAFLFTDQIGVGPLVAAPTATDDALGSGKWQGGVAAIYFNANSPQLQFGGLAYLAGLFCRGRGSGRHQSAGAPIFCQLAIGQWTLPAQRADLGL